MNDLLEKYKYKYEMHLHTCEASACAVSSAKEMVRAHKDAGYTGLFVTDHAWGGNTRIDRSLPYKEWVREFSMGYYNALREGDRLEIDVFFGWEAGFNGTEFLIYGLSPEWLMRHEELWDASIEKQYQIIHEAGGIVSHAHPYREEDYIPEIRLFPDYVDAVEIANATHCNPISRHHNNPLWDELACKYAMRHGKAVTGGSDVHNTLVLGGGVLFDTKMKDAAMLCNSIMTRDDYLLCNGKNYITKQGDIVAEYNGRK